MKDAFLPDRERLRRFQERSVASRYHLRPTYPPEAFAILNELIVDEPRVVLDLGCGTGNVARPLATYVERIDAVELSLAMLERARELPGGDALRIRWIRGRAEDVALDPPYALVTAGMSLHFMEWHQVLPRLARALTPRGVLAILNVEQQATPWGEEVRRIRRRFSSERQERGPRVIPGLEQYGLFHYLGERATAPLLVKQPVEDYIAAHYAYSSLAGMSDEQAARFEQEMRELLMPFAQDGLLSFSVVATVVWGKPCDPER
jgi:trans-aconitate methyltransferase